MKQTILSARLIFLQCIYICCSAFMYQALCSTYGVLKGICQVLPEPGLQPDVWLVLASVSLCFVKFFRSISYASWQAYN